MAGSDLLALGVVTSPRGVRGEVKVKCFTDRPEDLVAYGLLCDETGTREFRLRLVGQAKGTVVVRIEGVDDRDAAEALKGVHLCVPRDVLPEPDEGEFYHADLVGLRAELQDGTPFGEVTAIQDFGAGDLLEIRPEGKNRTLYVPFTLEVVPVVDVAAGRIVVVPPPGLLDEDAGDQGGETEREE